MKRLTVISIWTVTALVGGGALAEEPIALGGKRALFVDGRMAAEMNGVRLALHEPVERDVAVRFDEPWEGAFSGYVTVLKDGESYRCYYRGMPGAGQDGSRNEVTCYAESTDGVHWRKPNLGLFEVNGTRQNNVVLADQAPFSHNFAPFLDTRPGVPEGERYKALGGTKNSGLAGFVSADGLEWRKLRDEPLITEGAFDSQNVAFWSEHEQRYCCYFRTWSEGVRTISRTTSKDFRNWSEPVEMAFGDTPAEHLYTNQTTPYYRAPHVYVALAARFVPGRRVVTAAQAAAIEVNKKYAGDVSDGVFMTSRGGNRYDRTFMEGFIRPGIGPEHWTSRTNYPAHGIVPTGEEEMSIYVQHHYGQPSAALVRYTLRPDGFVSVHAPYEGGAFRTPLLTFSGETLHLNFATSAAGSVRVGIEGSDGAPVEGFDIEAAEVLVGNSLDERVRWGGERTLAPLAGTPVRLHFTMKDADIYSFRFE